MLCSVEAAAVEQNLLGLVRAGDAADADCLARLAGNADAPPWFVLAVSLRLWFTLLFANFAGAMAEGRGNAQA